MSRYISRSGDGPSHGVINCDRPRCRERHEWPLSVEPPERDYIVERGMSDEQRAARQELRTAAWQEVSNRPLPAGWIKLKYMLYQEGDKDNPDFYTFHSPHCAALYLNSLPGAKDDLPRKARRPGGDPILRAGGP